jgi:para-aminobenzoate synthetase component I
VGNGIVGVAVVGADCLGWSVGMSLSSPTPELTPDHTADPAAWQWRSLPLQGRTGTSVFAALFLTESIATLLESPDPHDSNFSQLARYSICAGGVRSRQGVSQQWTPTVGEILPTLQRLLQMGDRVTGRSTTDQPPTDQPPTDQTPTDQTPMELPFIGGWLGWLGYDLAREIEQLPSLNPDPLPFPVAFWYEPQAFAVLDHQAQTLWLAATAIPLLDQLTLRLEKNAVGSDSVNGIVNNVGGNVVNDIANKVANDSVDTAADGVLNSVTKAPPQSSAASIHFHTSQADYEAAIVKAKAYIQAGDIFQTNLSLRFSTQTAADSWSIYRALQTINPSPFSSYWKTPWGDVVSCSPERLVTAQRDDRDRLQVSTRPIAGTRKRGQTTASDQQLAAELISNDKERAEHIMLVDLERNDLGRVCEWGTVAVDELLTIEYYSHVMHLVSNVIGTLDQKYNSVDLIRALFPGGTITGCPKVRCMAIIEELETVRRSLFYGSCGYLDRRGQLDLNILIRTLLYHRPDPQQPAEVWGQVGAGIVVDSDPAREWFESLQKAQAQLRALQMVA